MVLSYLLQMIFIGDVHSAVKRSPQNIEIKQQVYGLNLTEVGRGNHVTPLALAIVVLLNCLSAILESCRFNLVHYMCVMCIPTVVYLEDHFVVRLYIIP